MNYPTPITLIYWIALVKKMPLLEWREIWQNKSKEEMMSVVFETTQIIDKYYVEDKYTQRLRRLSQ